MTVKCAMQLRSRWDFHEPTHTHTHTHSGKCGKWCAIKWMWQAWQP